MYLACVTEASKVGWWLKVQVALEIAACIIFLATVALVACCMANEVGL